MASVTYRYQDLVDQTDRTVLDAHMMERLILLEEKVALLFAIADDTAKALRLLLGTIELDVERRP